MSSPDQDDLRRAVFDEEHALRNLGGNLGLFLKMAAYFLSYSEDMLKPMRTAKDCGDWLRLREVNHKLMGSVCNFGTNAAYLAAKRLEATLDQGRLDTVDADFAAVETAIGELNGAFRARLDLPH